MRLSVGSLSAKGHALLPLRPAVAVSDTSMGVAPTGVPTSGNPCRQQLLSISGLPTGVVLGRGRLPSFSRPQARRGRLPLACSLYRELSRLQSAAPLQGTMVVASHPYWWPSRRSYIPVFQIRIEKIKEVKRPPL
ncbi:hypothetical protein B296_00011637 [Ensete ventricosum]|uniref:Uncharacterized protein n=1 Tax=Ensete ventricosum TaxID=4639 RepID=A0A426YZN8_ENSVE|nr:hypothetical protein B296_00011637 [Ensete ventricosum]